MATKNSHIRYRHSNTQDDKALVTASQIMLCLVLSLVLSACSDHPDANGSDAQTSHTSLNNTYTDFEELDWDALLPPDWQPEALLDQLGVDDISDDDPRADAVMKQIMELWNAAPTVPLLAGRRIRLTGFLVPLDFESDVLNEFLLIPYYGNCIHTPPPPANQTIHVVMPDGHPVRGGVFDVVRVSGTLRIVPYRHPVGVAAYRLDAEQVESEDLAGVNFIQPTE